MSCAARRYEVLVEAAETVSMRAVARCALHEGAGPRHMALLPDPDHPAERALLLVVNELDNTLVPITVQRGLTRKNGTHGSGEGGGGGGDAMTMAAGSPLSTLPADFDAATAPRPFEFYTAASHACVRE